MARSSSKSNVKVMLKDVVRSYNYNSLDDDYFERRRKIRGKRKKPLKRLEEDDL